MSLSVADRTAVNKELVDRFARDPKKVERWTDAIALTALYSLRRDERILLNRQNRAEGKPEEPVGEVSATEKVAAAEAIAEAIQAGDRNHIINAVSYAIYTLPGDYVRKLADRMVAVLREGANGR